MQGDAPAEGPWDEWQELRYFEPMSVCKGCAKVRGGDEGRG